MTYWKAELLNSSTMENAYCRWEGHQREWHDQIELGERVALALAEENK